MKKLKIQFWKAEKALAMQILEQEGLPKEKSEGFVRIGSSIDLEPWRIGLRGKDPDFHFFIVQRHFRTDAERDACLQKAVNAITDELFTGNRELKVGEMCEVRYDEEDFWKKRKLIAILPERYNERFIAETKGYSKGYSKSHCSWSYARPIAKRTEPTIEECGQLITYTWEEK